MKIKTRYRPTLKDNLTPLKTYVVNKKTFVILFLLIFILGTFIGMILTGYFGSLANPSIEARTFAHNIGIFPLTKALFGMYKQAKHPMHYIQGKLSQPKELHLDIGFKEYQQLAAKRQEALKRGTLFPTDEDYVKAKITYEGTTYKVKLRLKGDLPDHWGDENKWSFRVVLKDDKTLLGMKKFSLQHPKTRGYLTEWYYHQFLQSQKLISLRYKFVEVFVNGERLGVYAIEEHFGKQLVENNQRREGPLFKFDDTLCWYKRGLLDCGEVYTGSRIEPYEQSRVLADSELSEAFLKGKDLLESFRLGTLPTSKVFDVEQTATLFAITDLFGYSHSLLYTNIRFYYNPLSGKIEPIGFDHQNILALSTSYGLIGAGKPLNKRAENITWLDTFFEDETFYLAYIQALQNLSEEKVLDKFFETTQEEAEKQLKILYKDFPWYTFNHIPTLYKNQEYIHYILNEFQGMRAHVVDKELKKDLTLILGNIHPLPLEVVKVTYGNIIFEPNQQIVLQPKQDHKPIIYTTHSFSTTASLQELEKDLVIHYRVLGLSTSQTAKVNPWPHLSPNFATKQLLEPTHKDFSFIQVDTQEKVLTFMQGNHQLKKPLIIPKEFTVIISTGTTIDMINDAYIRTASPLHIRGTEEEQIFITSSDKTSKGIFVTTTEKSIIEHTIFEHFTEPNYEGLSVTGAITFYKAPVTLNNVIIQHMQAEDALNIINTKFTLNNVFIQDSSSDCFDSDFSEGNLERVTLQNCGNDGLDFSGSVVKLKAVKIIQAGDKALSAGEQSEVLAEGLTINDSYLGIVSKDYSKVKVTTSTFENVNYTYAVYQKKSEYGPATLEISDSYANEYTSLIEEGSELKYNKEIISGNLKNVYKELYG